MDRQVAYELFTRTLQQCNVQGIDLKKDLPGLLAWGYAKGCFAVPHSVHELSEWRKLGDKLWDAMLDDDKTAMKLGKFWPVVHNALLQRVAEKKAAEHAVEAHRKNLSYGLDNGVPLAPGIRTVRIPLPGAGGGEDAGMSVSVPSAPVVGEKAAEGEPLPPPAAPASPKPSKPSLSAPSSQGPEGEPGSAVARQRKEAWDSLAQQLLADEGEFMAFPASYTPLTDQQGNQVGMQAEFTPLDWKLLAQLRQTVSQYGFKSEPVRQMLEYLFSTQVLLPNDLRGIARLMFTEHQMILFGAHWQALVQQSVQIQRRQGDPLFGVTLDELMGLAQFAETDAQLMLGPDKAREAMRLFRNALDRVKEPGGLPAYLGVKQGREETLGSFVDRLAAAINKAGVPD